jgi:hypothetical protein
LAPSGPACSLPAPPAAASRLQFLRSSRSTLFHHQTTTRSRPCSRSCGIACSRPCGAAACWTLRTAASRPTPWRRTRRCWRGLALLPPSGPSPSARARVPACAAVARRARHSKPHHGVAGAPDSMGSIFTPPLAFAGRVGNAWRSCAGTGCARRLPGTGSRSPPTATSSCSCAGAGRMERRTCCSIPSNCWHGWLHSPRGRARIWFCTTACAELARGGADSLPGRRLPRVWAARNPARWASDQTRPPEGRHPADIRPARAHWRPAPAPVVTVEQIEAADGSGRT